MEQNVLLKLRKHFSEKLRELMLGEELLEDLDRVYLPLAEMASVGLDTTNMQIIGVNGAQGAGKTTFCALMKLVLEEAYGLKVLSLSIDDLYRGTTVKNWLKRYIRCSLHVVSRARIM